MKDEVYLGVSQEVKRKRFRGGGERGGKRAVMRETGRVDFLVFPPLVSFSVFQAAHSAGIVLHERTTTYRLQAEPDVEARACVCVMWSHMRSGDFKQCDMQETKICFFYPFILFLQ